MKSNLFLLILLLIPLTFAGNFNYDITDGKTLVEINIERSQINSLYTPNDIILLDFNESEISLIKYISGSFIEKSGSNYFFIADNFEHKGSSVKVSLPEGAYINEDYFIFPKNYNFETDGKNIIVTWDSSSEKEIMIPYKIHRNSQFFIWTLVVVVIISLFLFYFLRSKKNYSANLHREEKQIMEYLAKKKECWTKEIVKDLNISKVKLSRKIRLLEEKGLISKEPHGNENRIKLIK